MRIRRRELIQLGAGAGAGIALSPVPWKLLDDTAKWSQNWSWLPKLPRGERKVKVTRCTLCPGGCGVEAPCAGEQPVYLKGTEGALCAWGLGGHHLAYHPDRLHGPNMALDAAVATIAEAAQKGRCVIVDQRPGRAMSEIYRRFAAALPDAHYVAMPSRDGATLRAMERLAGLPADSLGVDFDRLRMMVGAGTPLLDGWAAQARVAARRKADPEFRLIQIEARQSATASGADEWIPARPGTEASVALAMEERLVKSGPAMVIADGDACAGFDARELEAIAALNLKVAGAALTRRRRLPWAVERGPGLDSIEGRSVRVLILGDATNGEAISWADMERTLAPDALIVSFSPYADGLSRRARISIPAFAAYEAAEDVPAPPYAKDASYGIAAPLHAKPLGGISPAEVLGRVMPGLEGQLEEVRKDRAARSGKTGGSMTPKLNEVAARGLSAVEAPDLAAVSFGWRGNGAGVSSPLITKLYQESGLRPGSLLARIHPDTAAAYGLRNRDRAAVEVNGTIREKTVCVDPAVLPRVVEIAESAIGARWAPATLRRLS
jgi:hypothetical protein